MLAPYSSMNSARVSLRTALGILSIASRMRVMDDWTDISREALRRARRACASRSKFSRKACTCCSGKRFFVGEDGTGVVARESEVDLASLTSSVAAFLPRLGLADV